MAPFLPQGHFIPPSYHSFCSWQISMDHITDTEMPVIDLFPSVNWRTMPLEVTKIQSAACVSLLHFLIALHFYKTWSATSAFQLCLYDLMIISPLGESTHQELVVFASGDSTCKHFCVSHIFWVSLRKTEPHNLNFLFLGLYSVWWRRAICFHAECSTKALL